MASRLVRSKHSPGACETLNSPIRPVFAGGLRRTSTSIQETRGKGMKLQLTGKYLSAHIWFLTAVYFVASLAHFIHNAKYIAFYPNMPAWLTRDTVYLEW